MIFLIRHGEPASSWSEHPDPGLSERGGRQAVAAAERLSGLGARAAWTSPLARCRETAAAFEASAGASAIVQPAVGEIVAPPGVVDRASWLRQAMTGTWGEIGDPFPAWRNAVVEAVAAAPDGAAIFSHFVAINAVVGALDGDDRVLVFRPGHASITRLERVGGRLRVAERGSEGPIDAI
ncbi:histidine phosphatase family protein [bacterium]|nr:histidine phosphatase family protein [bacterium]